MLSMKGEENFPLPSSFSDPYEGKMPAIPIPSGRERQIMIASWFWKNHLDMQRRFS